MKGPYIIFYFVLSLILSWVLKSMYLEGPKQKKFLVPNNLAYMGQSSWHSLLSQLIPRLKCLSWHERSPNLPNLLYLLALDTWVLSHPGCCVSYGDHNKGGAAWQWASVCSTAGKPCFSLGSIHEWRRSLQLADLSLDQPWLLCILGSVSYCLFSHLRSRSVNQRSCLWPAWPLVRVQQIAAITGSFRDGLFYEATSTLLFLSISLPTHWPYSN